MRKAVNDESKRNAIRFAASFTPLGVEVGNDND